MGGQCCVKRHSERVLILNMVLDNGLLTTTITTTGYTGNVVVLRVACTKW